MNIIFKLKKIINSLLEPDLVIVYNMGKVGSSTLVYSLKNAIQIHSLYDDIPPSKLRKKIMPLKRNLVFSLNRFLELVIIKYFRKKNKIIVAVRDPINRNRSMFFQDLELWLTKYTVEKGGGKSEYGLTPLINAYSDVYDHSFYINWFLKEFQKLTEINVNIIDLQNNSYQILHMGKNEVLIYQLEKINECKSKIEEFCNEKINWQNKNISSKKWYASLYNEFTKLPYFDKEIDLYENDIVKKLNYRLDN